MRRRANRDNFIAMALFITALALLPGCKKKEEGAPPPPTPAAPTAAKAPAPVQKQVTSAVPAAGVAPQLDFSAKKDPFKPFIVVAPKAAAVPAKVRVGALPIQNYDVNQFRVIGIVAGLKENRAMIVDPAGKGYVVKEGMLIGKNEGRISKITPAGIEVVEQYQETGKTRKRTVRLTLPRKE